MDSDSPWDKLVDDLRAEILNLLPIKMMVRFKLVSKEWNSLISCICIPRISPPSPSSTFCGFIYPQLYTDTSERVIRFAGDGNYRRFTFSYDKLEKKYLSTLQFELKPGDIQDCCNGFVLVLRDGVYYVFNPSTFECIHIPFNPDRETIRSEAECFASFVFDPTKSLDFKIITTNAGRITNPQRFDIFSSETWKWSSQIVPVDGKLNGMEWGTRSVYFNGAVYRMLMAAKYLVCINFGTKSREVLNVREIELPKDDDNIEEDCGTIGTSKGCFYYSNNDRSRLLIWMLKDDGVEWIPRACITMDDIVNLIKDSMRHIVMDLRGTDNFKGCAFHPNCDEIFLATRLVTIRYHFGINKCDIFHMLIRKNILLGQSCYLPYSRCPILLNKSSRGTKFFASGS